MGNQVRQPAILMSVGLFDSSPGDWANPWPDVLASSHSGAGLSSHLRDRHRPLLDISRQWVSKSMKKAATAAGIDPARAHPPTFRHTYGRNAELRGVPTPVIGHRIQSLS